jgi:hypothetical protein
MGDAKFFTILRHPVDRLISHYYYWQQDIDNPVFTQHPIRNYVMRRNLSLFEFAQLPAIQNFYTGVMFRDFPMEAFDLIGSVETLGDHREQIEDLCGASLTVGFENTSPRKSVGEGEIAALNKLLNLDIEFYQRWTGHRLQSG